jgi:hypothetical protein
MAARLVWERTPVLGAQRIGASKIGAQLVCVGTAGPDENARTPEVFARALVNGWIDARRFEFAVAYDCYRRVARELGVPAVAVVMTPVGPMVEVWGVKGRAAEVLRRRGFEGKGRMTRLQQSWRWEADAIKHDVRAVADIAHGRCADPAVTDERRLAFLHGRPSLPARGAHSNRASGAG